MKYSFVIPAYNEQDLIGDCIKSINKQKNKNFEVIVVDNGSNDKTAEIARGLRAKVVKEVKKGISNARNRGARKAKGKYLCFVDADGVLKKDWLDHVNKTIKQSDPDLIDGLILYKNKNLFKKILYNSYLPFGYLGLIILKEIFLRHIIIGNNTVIKKKVFLEIGGFPSFVSEQYAFSKKMWKKNLKSVFNLRMIVYYSSRGFENQGYLRTLLYWLNNAHKNIPQEGYSFKSKK